LKKLGVSQAKRHLAGTKVRIVEDFSIKLKETRKQLIPYMTDAKNKGNAAFLRKDKLVVNRRIYDLDLLQENYMLHLINRRLDNPAANEHISCQQELYKKNTDVSRQRDGLSSTHTEEGQTPQQFQ
jgi:hypothetical protein